MKIYDMHIHSWGTKPDPEKLLSEMENIEEGGTKFVDIRKQDKAKLKKNAN